MKMKLNKKLPGRSLAIICICMALWVGLIIRLFYLQVVCYDKYQGKVIDNVQKETSVSAARGSIYDCNMVPIATNVTVWRIFISPRDIEDETQSALISRGLSDILGVDYETISQRAAKKNRADETIKKNVDEDTYNRVLEFINQYDLDKQIHAEANTARYYPYGSLAAHVIGITGTDGGLFGLEYQYDEELTGVAGKYITAKDANGKNMPYKYDSYIDAQDGGNLVSTIDVKIQAVLEAQLKKAYEDDDPTQRLCGIVMEPSTGAIKAMAVYPSFDLNSPYTLDEDSQKKLDESGFAADSEEYNKLYWNLLYDMWKNKAVSETYEPGSTFKVLTTAACLQENVVKLTDTFYCGYDNYRVDGWSNPIKCHKKGGHQTVTLRYGLQQSCNVTLMNIASRLGKEMFLDYFQAFGFTDKTGIDLPGEALPIYTPSESFSNVSLAVYSFGQTFKVTPVQQLRAICAIANGGYLVTPHVVSDIVDDDGNVIWSFEDEATRQVISGDICSSVSEVLEEGVRTDGGAKNTYVPGYTIAAKTGTSEKRDTPEDDVVGSTVAYAPYDDAKLAVLIMVDTPTCDRQFGSVVAAPYVGSVMEDILPIVGVDRNYDSTDSSLITASVGNYSGWDIENAKQAIAEKGFSCEVVGDGTTVNSQKPDAGSVIYVSSGKIVLYTGAETEDDNSATVPDLASYSAEDANAKLVSLGFNVNVDGSLKAQGAVVTSQNPEAGTKLPKGSVVTISVRAMNGTE